MTDNAGERDIFRDHVATYKKYDDTLETLEWKKPGSSTYAIWYVRQYGTLMVWGDCYEATYQWNWQKGFDLAWISRCDQSYFISKCRASEHGRDPMVYDCHQMEKEMKEHFAESCTWKSPMCPEGECEVCDQRRKEEKLFEEYGGWRNMEDEFTWVWWLREYGHKVFGDDWWECVPSGKVLGPCIPLHLDGLKAAMKQLEESKNERTDCASTG
jgi:hypothetical protein